MNRCRPKKPKKPKSNILAGGVTHIWICWLGNDNYLYLLGSKIGRYWVILPCFTLYFHSIERIFTCFILFKESARPNSSSSCQDTLSSVQSMLIAQTLAKSVLVHISYMSPHVLETEEMRFMCKKKLSILDLTDK